MEGLFELVFSGVILVLDEGLAPGYELHVGARLVSAMLGFNFLHHLTLHCSP